MKKLSLLLTAAITAQAAMAQTQSVVFTQPRADNHNAVSDNRGPVGLRGSNAANKGTNVTQKGWFSVVDALYSTNAKGWLNYTYNDSTIKGVYSTSNNFITVHGLGYSFDPTSKIFSTDFLNISDVAGFEVKNTDAYTVDSITIVGAYERTQNYTDTMFIDVAFAPATGAYTLVNKNAYFTQLGTTDSTFHMANAIYDWTRNRISDSVSSVKRITKLLNAAAFADSLSNGLHSYTLAIPGGLSVPAGGKVVAFAHFASGHVYPFGTLSTAANVWNHYSYELNGTSSLPTQRVNDYNTGLFADVADRYHISPDYSSYSGHAILTPTYYYTAPAGFDDPYFQFYVSCATCYPLGVKNVTNIAAVNAYPNPATSSLTVSMKLKAEGNINVTLSNMVGQVVKSENLGRAAANTAKSVTINTSDLAAGMYLYTVESNGQRTTNRVMIAH